MGMGMEKFCGGIFFFFFFLCWKWIFFFFGTWRKFCWTLENFGHGKFLDIENFCWTWNFGHGKFLLDMKFLVGQIFGHGKFLLDMKFWTWKILLDMSMIGQLCFAEPQESR